jgi:hypothetical protein
MALPRRSRRTLTVEGVTWHWVARSEPVAVERDSGREVHVECRLIAERADAPRRRIVALFDSRAVLPTSNRAKYVDFPALTPALARAVISSACASGWDPTTAARDFVLERAGDDLHDAFEAALAGLRRQNFNNRSARLRRG